MPSGLRQETIQMYEDRLAEGGFLPYVARCAVAPTSRRKPRPSATSSARAIGATLFLAIAPSRSHRLGET